MVIAGHASVATQPAQGSKLSQESTKSVSIQKISNTPASSNNFDRRNAFGNPYTDHRYST